MANRSSISHGAMVPLIGVSIRTYVWQRRVPVQQKSDRDIFNFVFGNWDLHWGNVLLDETNSIVAIDNGVIRTRQRVRYGDLPFILRIGFSPDVRKRSQAQPLGPFPFESSILLEGPTREKFMKVVGPYVDTERAENYWVQRQRAIDASGGDLS